MHPFTAACDPAGADDDDDDGDPVAQKNQLSAPLLSYKNYCRRRCRTLLAFHFHGT